MVSKISGESLEVLTMLGNSRRSMGYIEFVARPDRNLLASALDLVDLGLVKRTESHAGERRVPDERESFYELSEKGRKYLDSLLEYASEAINSKNTQ